MELGAERAITLYNPALPIEIACEKLFHCYPDGSERPIANASKILFKFMQNYSQIQKGALAIAFAVKNFFQNLFGQKF